MEKGEKKIFRIDKGFVIKEKDVQQPPLEIFVMDNGFYINEGEYVTDLEKGKLLVNGAILSFDWTSFGKDRNNVKGFHISVQHVKGPFGVIIDPDETI